MKLIKTDGHALGDSEFVELVDRLAASPIPELPPCITDAPELLAALLTTVLALSQPGIGAPAPVTSAKTAALLLMSLTEGLLASGLWRMVIVDLARSRPSLVPRLDPWLSQVIWPCPKVAY